MKKFLLASILLVGLSSVGLAISLTEEELKIVNGNSNVGASLLVKKAILEEIKSSPFTEAEKKLIADAKENIEVEAFLNKLAQGNVVVSDEEVLKVYEDNKERFGSDGDVVNIMPQVKQLIFNQKLGEEKVKLVNMFIAKYNLNDILKKYFPTTESKDTEQQTNPK
ncbi:MAG: hypothetical protein LBT51_05570 [Fusobacteriaceae bacterium]|jgi:hypothetical protein|nr:hypothetical protein [Fusobacteriaceae bacterium]